MTSKIEAATLWEEERAADPRNGYSQANRWGPDFDCSSFVIAAWQQAGVPLKDKGATWTGNMREVLLACGFKIVTASVNLKTGEGLHRGDILLRDRSPDHQQDHAASCVGGGKVVHARSSEGNAQTGDQSGNEIRVQPYWDHGWDDVFRFPETVDYDEDGEPDPEIIHPDQRRAYYHIQLGDGCKSKGQQSQPQIRAWQSFLVCWEYDIGPDGIDGEYGDNTCKATKKWQTDAKAIGANVEINGIVDEDDWVEIIKIPVY